MLENKGLQRRFKANKGVNNMGGHNFGQTSFGKTVADAYRAACDEATWECGHDAYNGTISTTSGFLVIDRAGCKISTIEKQYLEADNGPIQKRGRCGAIVLTGKDAADYRKRHNLVGKKGVVVYFFGWAAS